MTSSTPKFKPTEKVAQLAWVSYSFIVDLIKKNMSAFLGWCCYNLQKRITLKFPLTNVNLQTTTAVGTNAQKIYELDLFF